MLGKTMLSNRADICQDISRIDSAVCGRITSTGLEVAVSKMSSTIGMAEAAHLCRRGELTRTGIKVAIVGRTNAGKSSLLNALAARDAAIVSSTPGTTRDTIEVAVDLAGHKVQIIPHRRRTKSCAEIPGIPGFLDS